jgi:apolipoprotein N-acyltransferase
LKNLFKNKYFVIYFAPFLLGAITVLSLEPFNLTLLNFFSFPFLLFLILTLKKATSSKYRNKKANKYFFYLGCSFGFGFFLFGNYWISISLTHDEEFKNLIILALILVPLFLSLFFGLVTLIIGPFARRNITFILLFSIIFSLIEFLRGNILTGFPWNLISYTWSWSLETIQILSYIGTYSFSLISITFFCVPFLFFSKKMEIKNFIFLITITIIFAGNYFYGLNKINSNKFNFDDDTYIKIISPNFSLSQYKSNSEELQLKRLIRISDPEKDKKTIFIWPEGIFYESYLTDIAKYKDLFKNAFSENHLVILGINNFQKDNIQKDAKYFNSLVVLNNNLEVKTLYNKVNLVPFGEFLPFEKFFSKIGLKKITRGYNSFSSGENRKLISLPNNFNNKLVLPLICYEIIYSGKIKSKNQSPDVVINISEDAWFGESIGPYQHFSKAIYRSIEEGIFIARSANKGISAFINPNGQIIKSLNTREAGNIEVNFPYFYKKTIFSQYKNKIFFLIIFMYILSFLILRKIEDNE